MKLLYNNNCNVIDYTIIDTEDINKISKYKISKCGNYAYANINNKQVALHRIITNTINELDKIHNLIDHIIGIKDDKEVTFLCKYIKNKHIEACPNCVFNNYFCHGLLCNIVVLKVVKDEEMKNNK